MNMQALFMEMVKYEQGCPSRIQHFTKVYSYARTIGLLEQLEPGLQAVTEAAALVHDIGIRPSLEKYGSGEGKLQEQEGPAPARAMLKKLGFAPEVIDRVAYLVGHHHSYSAIDGADYQILVEADFLVNLFEGGSGPEAIRKAYDTIFKTEAGRNLCRIMFDIQ